MLNPRVKRLNDLMIIKKTIIGYLEEEGVVVIFNPELELRCSYFSTHLETGSRARYALNIVIGMKDLKDMDPLDACICKIVVLLHETGHYIDHVNGQLHDEWECMQDEDQAWDHAAKLANTLTTDKLLFEKFIEIRRQAMSGYRISNSWFVKLLHKLHLI